MVAYDVLPEEAGLVQLMREGAITRLEDGYMLIQRAIPRLPAGMRGGPLSRFMLGKGVPEPAGSDPFTCIVSEETGRPLQSADACP